MLFLDSTTSTDQTQTQLTQFEKIFDFHFDFIESPQVQSIINKIIEVLFVIVVFFILCKITDTITRIIRKKMTKKKMDKTITNVVYYISNKGIKLILIFMAVGCLGIDTSSIVGLFTATGLGIGLAVQGGLSNFAGGFLILINRPFKLDDYIECQGTAGTVEDIKLFYTYLRTPDNKVVLIPNGALIGGVVTNYSSKPTRRVDITFSIDYDANFMEAEKVILEVCKSHGLILKDPAPTVRIGEWADSSIELSTKVWVKSDDYWTVKFDLLEQVYVALNEAHIAIPYNQIQVSYRNVVEEKKQAQNK